jgi:flagellar hook-length control protein FliK
MFSFCKEKEIQAVKGVFMKTDGVSSNQPTQAPSDNASKTDQKPKTQKEFKSVLQESGTSALPKKKVFTPLRKGVHVDSHTPGSGKTSGLKRPSLKSGERDTVDSAERRLSSKSKKSDLPEAPTPQINPNAQAPAPIQGETEISKTQNPGLNIDEIQSIVNKVQVGVNEEGLPECRFEIETKNLGKLDLKVSAEKEQIRIEFATDDANAQQVLEQNMKELHQLLQDKGLTLVETKFTQRDQQDSDQQQSSGGDDQDAYPSLPPTGRKRTFSL